MRSLWDLTRHLTARADDNHAAPQYMFRKTIHSRIYSCTVLTRVRFLAYHRIKPHAPPLVRAPVNSFEFQPCDRTPQVGHLSLSLDRRHSIADNECPSFTAWTTRVSNPVCYPRFRALASVSVQWAGFPIGIPTNIYEFHLYTCSSAHLSSTLVWQFPTQYGVEPRIFTSDLPNRLDALYAQ